MPANTVFDALPKLKRFDPRNPPDVRTLTLRKIPFDRNDHPRIYSNGCYTFTWYDQTVTRDSITIFTDGAKGLFRLDGLREIKNASGSNIRIKPPKGRLRERDLFHDDRVERLILMKTLADLDDAVLAEHSLHIIDPETYAMFRDELAKIRHPEV